MNVPKVNNTCTSACHRIEAMNHPVKTAALFVPNVHPVGLPPTQWSMSPWWELLELILLRLLLKSLQVVWRFHQEIPNLQVSCKYFTATGPLFTKRTGVLQKDLAKSRSSETRTRLGCKIFQSLCNLTGTSTAALPRCLSNCRGIRSLSHPISPLPRLHESWR